MFKRIIRQTDQKDANTAEETRINAGISPTNSPEGDDAGSFDQTSPMGSSPEQPMKSNRSVAGARLVSKKQEQDGTWSELWIYNGTQDYEKNSRLVQDIIAGTEIDANNMQSPDGTQQCKIWTCGNINMVKLTGLGE